MPGPQIIYTELIKENRTEFIAKLLQISEALGINPNWLMWVMWKESKIDSKAVNKQPGDDDDPYTRARYRATGLIQFMPQTAEGLATTNQALYMMSNIQQLNYVYKYFLPYKNKIKSVEDLYLVTFFPLAIGKADDWVFETSKISRSKIAQQNPGIDANKDGKITLAEFKGYVLRGIPDQIKNLVVGAVQNIINTVKKKSTWITIALLISIYYYSSSQKE